jgi:hypothetical protein
MYEAKQQQLKINRMHDGGMLNAFSLRSEQKQRHPLSLFY